MLFLLWCGFDLFVCFVISSFFHHTTYKKLTQKQFQVAAGFESEIKSTRFESLSSGNPTNYGNNQILNVDDFMGVAQFRCSCDVDCSGFFLPLFFLLLVASFFVQKCYITQLSLLHSPPHSLFSEPTLVHVIIEQDNSKETILYGLYNPAAVLPPMGGVCETFYETNEGVEGDADLSVNSIISGLTFVVVRCKGWEFYDGGMGVVTQRIYYDTGDGVKYPRIQNGLFFHYFPFFFFFDLLFLISLFTFSLSFFLFSFSFLLFFLSYLLLAHKKNTVFGPVQFTLPCGTSTMYSESLGFGQSGYTYITSIVDVEDVESWSRGVESLYLGCPDSIGGVFQ